jgi:prepilin-type N-terminal cleavage/methylation domain-containing protein
VNITYYSRPNRGFTLLELLLVMSMLGVVSTMGFVGFVKVSYQWNDLVSALTLEKTLARCFTEFRKDFENILPTDCCQRGLEGMRASVEDSRRYWNVNFEDDSVSFPVSIYNPLQDRNDRFLVRYKIERTTESARFIRYVSELDIEDAVPQESFSLENILAMRILYSDGKRWNTQMPDAVRISLTCVDPRDPTRHISRMVVFNIHVK